MSHFQSNVYFVPLFSVKCFFLVQKNVHVKLSSFHLNVSKCKMKRIFAISEIKIIVGTSKAANDHV